MTELDADGDGAPSAKEVGLDGARSEAQTFFAAIDSDADGALSETELEDRRSQMEQAMQSLQAFGAPSPLGPMGDDPAAGNSLSVSVWAPAAP